MSGQLIGRVDQIETIRSIVEDAKASGKLLTQLLKDESPLGKMIVPEMDVELLKEVQDMDRPINVVSEWVVNK